MFEIADADGEQLENHLNEPKRQFDIAKTRGKEYSRQRMLTALIKRGS